MGWDLRDPWQYEQWRKENRRRAERMADMPLEDWAADYTEDEINKIIRAGERYANKQAPAPSKARKPWVPPPGTYGKWPWYAPTAEVKGQEYLGDINRMLPYMAPEDVEVLTRQLYLAGGGKQGPFKTYLKAKPGPRTPTWRTRGRKPYRKATRQIRRILAGIKDPTARAWAQAVFDTYGDWRPKRGMRSAEQQQVFGARMEELMSNIPGAAQPYAAAIQRLVQPTVRRPGYEWYEMPARMRTAPTNWRVLGYQYNPAWR
ncbi:MAG: hypothetical protein GTO63_12040 [Anaerolineae bacterium]|nr:hypothetical protein [Anaerolineae bacterium]NIN95627.1 hypothetical protein [Anaerolineae bacterium]NIQ78585.1 hypothetical protein [Anaerolineae bacterium]